LPIAEGKKVTIKLKSIPKAQIEGDRLALRRVVFNLLSNALDSSASGASIDVQLTAQKSHAYVLSVTNHGEPINAEDLQNLFQRFSQGQRFGVGAGLGLYLARQVVEGHGGEISCSSSRKVGTTIRALLPKKAVAVDSTPKYSRSRLSVAPEANF